MLPNIFLPNPKTGKGKDGKNTNMDSCHFSNLSSAHFSESNSSDKNLSKSDNIIDEIFSNDEDKEKLMAASKKAKWVLSKDPTEAMEPYFENLGMKNMATFYGMKNMAGLEQH